VKLLTDRQTDRRTNKQRDKRRVSHNLLGGGEKNNQQTRNSHRSLRNQFGWKGKVLGRKETDKQTDRKTDRERETYHDAGADSDGSSAVSVGHNVTVADGQESDGNQPH